jgi:HNH endonuclease
MKWFRFDEFQPFDGDYVTCSDSNLIFSGIFYGRNVTRFFVYDEYTVCDCGSGFTCPECKTFSKFINPIFWCKLQLPPRRKYRGVYPLLKLKVLKRDKYKCKICNNSPALNSHIKLEIDHIIPFSKGGSDKIDNLQVLCNICNHKKGNSQ